MYKIAISGKANSGKDTVAKLFAKVYQGIQCERRKIVFASLADPIKKIAKIMFPRTKRKSLYGPSKYREGIIPGAFKNNIPLTYRLLLQELGTEIGRGYKESIWLDVLDCTSKKAKMNEAEMFIVADSRFRNEFDHLKSRGYVMIRVKRQSQLNMNHASEMEQESIQDSEFDFIIDNDSTLESLEHKVSEILEKITE